jgi:hypothetical protein
MKRVGLLCALLALGCGPLVALPEDTDGASETMPPAGSSTDDEPSSDADGGDDGPFSTGPNPTTASPSTSGAMTTGDTFGSGSSGGIEQPQCWTSGLVFEAPEEARLIVADQDGSGDDELWLTFFDGGGPGSATEVFRFSPDGIPEPAGFFPGFMTGLHDIDGDLLGDAVGFAFGGGGPPSVAFIPGEPGFVDGEPIPTVLGFEDGFEAFIDVSNDGFADFVRNADGTTITELLVGDGGGDFFPITSMKAPFQGDVAVLGLDGGGGFVMAESEYFDPLGDCIGHPFAVVAANPAELVPLWTQPNIEGWIPSAPLAATGDPDDGIVYTRVCFPGDNSVSLQVTEFAGPVTSTDQYGEGSFLAVGDFSGDGRLDATFGTLDQNGMETMLGQGGIEFSEPEFSEVLYGDPIANRVYVVDMDLDGRDEIFVGAATGGGGVDYYRLDLEPCL